MTFGKDAASNIIKLGSLWATTWSGLGICDDCIEYVKAYAMGVERMSLQRHARPFLVKIHTRYGVYEQDLEAFVDSISVKR